MRSHNSGMSCAATSRLSGLDPSSQHWLKSTAKEIPFYNIRHIVKPGLSGWAQLYHDNHPHHAAQVEATREKLSYDLYYLKHRSFALDIVVALKTIKKLITRSGV
jgi:lipopolysaccharide/colanic/teichoic acid biosynthesis glycosyltransferase